MAESDNEQLVRRYYDRVWNEGNLAVCDELISPAEIYHQHGSHGAGGPEWDRQAAQGFRAIFPDVRFTVEVIVDGGDLLAAFWRAEATHAATGKPMKDYTGVNIFRIADGQIVEVWNTRDDLGMFEQLGLIPPRTELRTAMARSKS